MNSKSIKVVALASFRKKIASKLAKNGAKKKACVEMDISRMALWRFLNKGSVSLGTLERIVEKFEGLSVEPLDFTKK